MKIERLSQDKIRIFLTFDDLMERGIQKEDMWREIPKVHELFSEMMDQAYSELGFDASGPLAVEVFALPAQGMVVIVTRGKTEHAQHFDRLDDAEEDDVYEMEVTLEETDIVTYAFADFEHLLQAVKILGTSITKQGALFHYKNRYILQLEPSNMQENQFQLLIAVLSEYGEATSVTEAVLCEYGKTVISQDAILVLSNNFR